MKLSVDAVWRPMTIQSAVGINQCKYAMEQNHRHIYGISRAKDVSLVNAAAGRVLSIIACTDAPYHNLGHTLSVISVGQQILEGKQKLDGDVSPQDWIDVTTALMFHDVGYVKGACRNDRVDTHRYVTAADGAFVQLSSHTTDASLAPYHVSRGQVVADELLGGRTEFNVDIVKTAIEFTRFPVPSADIYSNTSSYFGLVRAADLIGQLADPNYLEKLPDLFTELLETGRAQALGYYHSDDMRRAYPAFYRQVVYPYIEQALLYLCVTPGGRQTVNRLYANLAKSEHTAESAAKRKGFRQIFVDDYGRLN